MVQRRLVHLRALRGVDRLHQVHLDRAAGPRRPRAMSSSTFSRSLRNVPVALEAERVDPEPAEPALSSAADGDLLEAEDRGRGVGHGSLARGAAEDSSRPRSLSSRPVMSAPKATVHFRSLGCPKNLLDTEVMLGHARDSRLRARRAARGRRRRGREHLLVHRERARGVDAGDPRGGGPARERAAARARRRRLPAAALRRGAREGAARGRRLRRHRRLPRDRARSSTTRSPGAAAASTSRPGAPISTTTRSPRILIGPGHSAYVKIAEGCDRVCTFCAIPGIRGRFQSRRLDSLVARGARSSPRRACARSTSSRRTRPPGARTCRPARPRRPKLADLVRALDAVDGLDWIRLLYLYPSAVTDDADRRDRARRSACSPTSTCRSSTRATACSRRMRRGTTAERQRALVERSCASASRASRCAPPSSWASPARPTTTSRRSSTSCASRASIASACSATRTRRAPRAAALAGKVPRARRARALPRGSRSSRRGIHGRAARARGSAARRDVLVDAAIGARSRARAAREPGARDRRRGVPARRRRRSVGSFVRARITGRPRRRRPRAPRRSDVGLAREAAREQVALARALPCCAAGRSSRAESKRERMRFRSRPPRGSRGASRGALRPARGARGTAPRSPRGAPPRARGRSRGRR